jgi:hypothetical protein
MLDSHRILDAGMARTSIVPITRVTLRTPEMEHQVVVHAQQPSPSSSHKSCTRLCGTSRLSWTRASSPQMAPTHSLTAWVLGECIPYSINQCLKTYTLFSGAAAHGDYIFGWKDQTLQKAMDNNCNLNKDCTAAGIHAQTPADYNACTKPQMAPEPVDGCK